MPPLARDHDLVGIGLYTLAEAARLAGTAPAQLARWLRGYSVGGKRYPALWAPQVDLDDGKLYLGFRDLMEARVARAFIAEGVSPQTIRAAILRARELIGDERPLSTGRFKTDGKAIFIELATSRAGDEGLLELVRGQWNFREIVAQTLKDIDLGPDGAPLRWWPRGKAAGIVVDPARAFGQPIDAATSVPIAALSAAVGVEGSAEAVARAWEVPLATVRRAIEFAGERAARKAA